jgi:hypothetical protein
MAAKDTHHEVFLKKNRKASWKLVEATPDRDDAMALGHRLKNNHPSGSVRVVREVWQPAEGEFLGTVIFESGPEAFADPKEKKGEASLPCLTPDDLSGPAARDTLRRVLSGWLERNQAAPLELLHRADLIEDLDGSDTDLQHAIQKVAVARAQTTDASVHAYVRLITDLVEKGVAQARREAKAAKKSPKAKSFADMAAQIHAEGAPEKRLRKAIAESLSEERDFGSKAKRLLDMQDDLPADPEARAFAIKEADNFLAEMLSFDGAIQSVFGTGIDLGDQVVRLTAAYEGKPHCDDLAEAPEAARKLAKAFSSKDFISSHIEIAKRILSALRAPKRFRPKSVMEEIELARKLAQRLIVASGPNLHPDSLVDAFTHRSAKLLAPDVVDEALEGAKTPAEQIECLFQIEDNIVGDQNKKKLAAYIRARLGSAPAESHFVRGDAKPLERLAALAALQQRARRGSFPDEDKAELSKAFDDLGLKVLDETKILKRVADSGRPPIDTAHSLLKLAASGVLPIGRCTEDAKLRALRLLSSEMGKAAAKDTTNRAVLTEIQCLMGQIEAA